MSSITQKWNVVILTTFLKPLRRKHFDFSDTTAQLSENLHTLHFQREIHRDTEVVFDSSAQLVLCAERYFHGV